MNLTVVTPPPFEPVTLLQVYAQLRLNPDHEGSPGEETHPDDAMLSAHIKAAREYVEVATRRSLVQQTLRISALSFPEYCARWWSSRNSGWPFSIYGQFDRIMLRRPPLIRVETVRYYDSNNTAQTLSSSEYYVTGDQVPELRFVSAFTTPTLYDRPDALTIDYAAGYAPEGSPATTQAEYAGNVPETLKQAVLIGVQLLYDNLSAADREAMERMREAMIQTYRIQHV